MAILKQALDLIQNKETEEQKLFKYMDIRDRELEQDVMNRVFGIKNKTGGYSRAGYKILREFYDGDQWFYNREQGSSMNITNFCRMTVDNFTAFMTQEEPEIDIPPRDPLDDIELLRVREVERLVHEVLENNQWFNIYQEGVQNGSLLGDTMIAGPFWNDEEKRVWFVNIKRPEFVRIIWDSNEGSNVLGFIYHYWLTFEQAEKRFGDKLKEKGIKLKPNSADNQQFTASSVTENRDNTVASAISRKVLIREFWDDEVRLLTINNDILEFDKHNFGFVPLLYIKNAPHPTSTWGVSDIEDLLDPQVKYNELDSDMHDILKQVAYASIFGKNIDLEEIQAGMAKVYDMGDDSEVFPDPRQTNFPFLQTYLQDKSNDVTVMSGIPDVFQGSKQVRDVSGRALSVLLTPINNAIRGKEKRWGIAIKELVKNMLILVERFVPNGEILIQNWYKVDVFFPGTLVRDVSEELNKLQFKVQSQQTTMKNIGIASPKDEQTLIKKELTDPQLIVELSKSPQMQFAILQQMLGQMREQAGENEARGGQSPLGQGENQPGDSPASAPGSSVPTGASPEGNLNRMASGQGQQTLI